MNTKRNAIRRLEEEIASAEAPPHSEQVPKLKEDTNIDQALVNPPPLMDGDIRASLIQLAQSATVNDKVLTA